MRRSLMKHTATDGFAGHIHQKNWWRKAYNQRYLYLMSVPFVL